MSTLVCLHGLTDTGRSWDLVRDQLAAEHDLHTPTLLGHAGGPAYAGDPSLKAIADQLEKDLDAAGIGTAHIAGNSLGGALALELGARGRADTVVALAPAGGWTDGGKTFEDTAKFFRMMHNLLQQAAPHADAIAATPEGRARALQMTAVNQDHIPSELIAHQIRSAAACEILLPLMDWAAGGGLSTTNLGPIDVPVRIVWGTEDQILPYPASTEGFKTQVPDAEWVILDNVGHCPQLDVPEQTARLILEVTSPT
ncbi:MAG: hypothetical protein QOF76_949 [Solirubrobacteraceae bacterium]|jgi:pimeloyl-ACP methyl ester carboxylesterase|nr:hypothetical protein [Solirubrobacteraceae bacterium]